MHRWAVWLCVLAGIALAWVPCAAVDLTEVGVQFALTHDPLLADGRVQLRVSAGVYGKLSLTGTWMLRVGAGSPLGVWAPYDSLATIHALGARWVAEAELSAQGIGDMTHISLLAGARWVLSATGSTRVMLASFPLGLAMLHGSIGWTSSPLFAPNVSVDVAWAPSERWLLGETFGVTLARLGELSGEMAVPLGEEYGLLVRATTHAGFRP